jgi:hypothetical protein
MKTKLLLVSLLISGTAIANCPDHRTVTYNCVVTPDGSKHCQWNPRFGWYQGSANHSDYQIKPGSHANQFLRAFWTPNAHVTPDTLSYGVTICQYSFRGQIITLYQKDRSTNIPDPRRKHKDRWTLSEWEDAKGLSCYNPESQCDFDYGERL